MWWSEQLKQAPGEGKARLGGPDLFSAPSKKPLTSGCAACAKVSLERSLVCSAYNIKRLQLLKTVIQPA